MMEKDKVYIKDVVYIVGYKLGEDYFLKIGVSKNVDNRINQLQTGSPFKIEKLFIISRLSNAYNIEKDLLSYFKVYKHNGEWIKIKDFEKFKLDLKTGLDNSRTSQYKITDYLELKQKGSPQQVKPHHLHIDINPLKNKKQEIIESCLVKINQETKQETNQKIICSPKEKPNNLINPSKTKTNNLRPNKQIAKIFKEYQYKNFNILEIIIKLKKANLLDLEFVYDTAHYKSFKLKNLPPLPDLETLKRRQRKEMALINQKEEREKYKIFCMYYNTKLFGFPLSEKKGWESKTRFIKSYKLQINRKIKLYKLNLKTNWEDNQRLLFI